MARIPLLNQPNLMHRRPQITLQPDFFSLVLKPGKPARKQNDRAAEAGAQDEITFAPTFPTQQEAYA
jgi:hypothetical protein